MTRKHKNENFNVLNIRKVFGEGGDAVLGEVELAEAGDASERGKERLNRFQSDFAQVDVFRAEVALDNSFSFSDGHCFLICDKEVLVQREKERNGTKKRRKILKIKEVRNSDLVDVKFKNKNTFCNLQAKQKETNIVKMQFSSDFIVGDI